MHNSLLFYLLMYAFIPSVLYSYLFIYIYTYVGVALVLAFSAVVLL